MISEAKSWLEFHSGYDNLETTVSLLDQNLFTYQPRQNFSPLLSESTIQQEGWACSYHTGSVDCMCACVRVIKFVAQRTVNTPHDNSSSSTADAQIAGLPFAIKHGSLLNDTRPNNARPHFLR